jgi:hypothetical protein
MNQRLSQLRSKLERTEEEIRQLLQQFRGRSPLLPASLYTMKRRCGKEGCRCARGQLHGTTVLSYRGGEKPQTITPPADRVETFKAITDDDRRVRQARARLVQLQQQLLHIVDQMQELRVQLGERELNRMRSASSRSRR